MELPKSNSSYSEKQYWDVRYQTEENYEWFAGYKPYRDILRSNIKPDDKILTLGCGNSRLSEDMYRDGFQLINNTDYSQIVIDNMRKQTKDLVNMTWSVKDIYALDYKDESFDVVLEKGTLDALLVNEKDPWRMSQQSLDNMSHILASVARILTSGGRFISITFAQPRARIPIYGRDEYDWDVRYQTFGDTFHFFIYTMTKGAELTDSVRKTTQHYFSQLNRLHERPNMYIEPQREDFVFDIGEDLFS